MKGYMTKTLTLAALAIALVHPLAHAQSPEVSLLRDIARRAADQAATQGRPAVFDTESLPVEWRQEAGHGRRGQTVAGVRGAERAGAVNTAIFRGIPGSVGKWEDVLTCTANGVCRYSKNVVFISVSDPQFDGDRAYVTVHAVWPDDTGRRGDFVGSTTTYTAVRTGNLWTVPESGTGN